MRKITPPAINPDGQVNLEGMRIDLAFYREIGQVQDPAIKPEDIVDMSFVDAAVRELGPYRPVGEALAPWRATETSVLIAGAGPVGLALACELGLRGIDCVLIEKRDGAIAVPKMSAVSPRNMEFCRRWGIADTVRTAVWPESRNADFVFVDHLRGRELARSRRPTSAQRGALALSPETACHCPQIFFDPILAGAGEIAAERRAALRRAARQRSSRMATAVRARLCDVGDRRRRDRRGALSRRLRRSGRHRARGARHPASAASAWWRTASTSSSARRSLRRCTTRAGRASTG